MSEGKQPNRWLAIGLAVAAAAALGYAPTHEVADGMAETVAWFAQRTRRK